MMDEKCIARVVPNERWGSFHVYGCNRKRGYGKDGMYCKQHAKRHPADDQETVTMYAAKQEYNSFDVAVCQVFDVTDASLVIKSAQTIFGYAPSKGHTKIAPSGNWWFFSTAREALEWVHLRMVNKANDLRVEINRIEKDLEPVDRMLKLDDLEDKVAEVVAERISNIKKELGHEG